MQKCRQFIEGPTKFELITDQNPLVPILNYHSLDNRRMIRKRIPAMQSKTSPGTLIQPDPFLTPPEEYPAGTTTTTR